LREQLRVRSSVEGQEELPLGLRHLGLVVGAELSGVDEEGPGYVRPQPSPEPEHAVRLDHLFGSTMSAMLGERSRSPSPQHTCCATDPIDGDDPTERAADSAWTS
jgi:hypothetical protein